MLYEPFSNDSSVNTVRKAEDVKDFNHIRDSLGFSLDIDLVTFCAAVGLYKVALKKKITKSTSPSIKKLATMTTFLTRYMYDYIIRNFLDIEKPHIKDFDEYFYSGFIEVQDWYKKNGTNMEDSLHAFSEIITDLLEDEDKPK